LESDNNVKELKQKSNIYLTNAVIDVNIINLKQVKVAQRYKKLVQRQREIEQEKLKQVLVSSRITDIVNF